MLEPLDGCCKQVSLHTKGGGESLQDGDGEEMRYSFPLLCWSPVPTDSFSRREEEIKCDLHLPVGGLCLLRETFLLSFR